MRKYIMLIILPVFLGGTPLQDARIAPTCNCPDTFPGGSLPDSVKTLLAPFTAAIVTQTVDSFQEAKQREIDSLSYVRDSLKIEVKYLLHKKLRKKVLGLVDSLPPGTRGPRIWRWWFWEYPDGTREFYKVTH